MIRIIVVDDQDLVRTGLRMILDAEHDIEVVAECANGREAIEDTRRLRPDVVLMDIRMPDVDGLDATEEITREMGTEVSVLILTTFDPDEYVYRALRAGASGFLLKDTPPGDLVSAVRVVAAGEALLAPSITRRLVERFAQQLSVVAERPPELERLSEREVEVLHEVARGRSNAEIADALYLSAATVKTHVSNVLTKLGLRDRVQAVVFAYEHGIVTPAS